MAGKLKTSPMWRYFSQDKNKPYTAVCDICKTSLSYKSTITCLKRHMNRRHPTVILCGAEQVAEAYPLTQNRRDYTSVGVANSTAVSNVSPDEVTVISHTSSPSTSTQIPHKTNPSTRSNNQTMVTGYVRRPLTATQKKKIDFALAKMIFKDLQPYSLVEDHGFVEYTRALNPDYELPSKYLLSNSLINTLYESCPVKVKDCLLLAPTVCLTTDCWTSINTESFMAITAHFILPDTMSMQSILLECFSYTERHTSENLCTQVKRVVSEWSIDDKIIMVVSDNAPNIVRAIQMGKWKKFGCLAHTLNLIVQWALKHSRLQAILQKVRQTVEYFKRSTVAMAELRAYLAQNNLPVEKLIQDVSTRWNSTLYMLERIHKLSNAVKSTAAVLDANVPIIAVEEWVIIKDMCIVLKPFEIVTREMSADKYVSASKVIVLKKGLLSSCKKMKDSGKFHCIATEVIESLESGLAKYYGDIEKSKTFAMCTFLDPRFKKGRMFDNPHDAKRIKEHVIEMVAHEILKSGHEENVEESRSSAEIETAAEDELGEFSPWAIYNEDFASCQEPKNSTPSSRAIVEVNR